MIRSQTLQTSLHRATQILAMVSATVWVCFAFGERVLGRDNKMIPVALYEFTHEFLTCSIGIVVGRVDEIPARFGKRVEDFAAFLFRRAPAPVIAKGHRAET